MIEELVAELLGQYMPRLQATEDEYEYCAVVTAVLVFKELALIEFKQGISPTEPTEYYVKMLVNNPKFHFPWKYLYVTKGYPQSNIKYAKPFDSYDGAQREIDKLTETYLK